MGLIFAHGTVPQAFMKKGINRDSESTVHLFVGAEWMTPLTITAQIDFMNLSPRGSVLVGKKF